MLLTVKLLKTEAFKTEAFTADTFNADTSITEKIPVEVYKKDYPSEYAVE